MFKFLTLLPAVLSFVGFVIYLIWKSNRESSPIAKSVIDTIKSKSTNLPELDKRLNPKQVFNLINTHSELREILSSNDYNLLLYTIKSDEKRIYLYGLLTFLLVCISLFTYYKVEQYQNRLVFSEIKLYGVFNNQQYENVTTKDDLLVKWNYQGQDEEVSLSITSIKDNITKGSFKCHAKDAQLIISNKVLSDIWGMSSNWRCFSYSHINSNIT